jgi:hypothetical protein
MLGLTTALCDGYAGLSLLGCAAPVKVELGWSQNDLDRGGAVWRPVVRDRDEAV